MEYISRTAGTTKYYRRGYNLSPADAAAGCIDPAYTCLDHDGQRRVHIQEYTGPRLSYQDISNASRHPNVSLMSTGQPSKLCPFHGWFPMYTDWPVPSSVHDAYERQPWPKKNAATIETDRLCLTDDGPVVATAGQEASHSDQPKVDDTLDAVWQDMQNTGAT